ncbi:MAG: zinc ribbon domain-containing protein [Clostridia bacterium]|nr:zinc ribbon domain-containing protein [Clostridia bacterium]MDE7257060.1 zinc ribbon domain-containing protein [Clostridia bacterium]
MFCKNCGREISDNAVVCPNCGVQVKAMSNSSNGENTIAIVGFVFSFLIALVGLICSIMGYKKAVNEGAPYKGLALAGIIISIISMVFGFILTIIYGAAIAAVLA